MTKRAKKEPRLDSRVKSRHFSLKEFSITFAILCVLSAGQALILGAYVEFKQVPIDFALGMAGYWAIVAAVFSLVTHQQIKKKFDKPMRTLSNAAKQVADGDFSVWVEPVHHGDKTDYVDVMFEDFNKMVEQLASIETLQNDFISNVSHEFKTPLAVIQNYTAVLQKEDLEPQIRKEYTDTIITATKKLTALVSNILKLSKLEIQEIIPVAEPYDLCRQLCNCALSFEALWEEKNIEFIADIEDRATIIADENMLDIVWNNLLSNALKFTSNGGKIILRQTSSADTITVTISDNGQGMNEQTTTNIFAKFYQADSSRSQEGNGLGLALVLKVVELVGGSISVESKPDVGSTFKVILPVQ